MNTPLLWPLLSDSGCICVACYPLLRDQTIGEVDVGRLFNKRVRASVGMMCIYNISGNVCEKVK